MRSPNVLTILKRDGVLVGVGAGVCGAGWGAKEVWVEVPLVVVVTHYFIKVVRMTMSLGWR